MFASVSLGGRGRPGVLVIGRLDERGGLSAAELHDDEFGTVAAACARPESSADLGSLTEAFPYELDYERVIVVGLGKKTSLTRDGLRDAAATVGRHLSRVKARGVQIDLAELLEAAGLDPEHGGQAFGEALGLLAWDTEFLRGSATPKKKPEPLTVKTDDARFEEGLRRGLGLAESANYCRTLSQTPANIATTTYIAAEARKMARKTGLKFSEIAGDGLEKHKLAGLINVGKASEHGPRLIRLEYQPGSAAARKRKPVVLVGKTIVYDTGGLSLKVGGSMPGMKRDKDGGCAVIGAMHAIATVVKPNRPVVALLPTAENSVSDEAYRPDDVIEFANGVTVEVTNTDAEGRLVLADALAFACKNESPEAIVDMATLTGGVVVALGSTYAGLWCDDDGLRGRLECAAEGTGERVWRLPHHQEYRDMMKSPCADIVNSAPVREAHPIQGAAFLSYFVADGIPWAHVDIAGVHATGKDRGPIVPGPTGFGVRLLAELVEQF
ncbi:MAG: leucyl aminopeptidase family protein [Planctomycetota bacterium]